jgi:hypothetical protein
MGHDIEIINSNGVCVETAYMTGNFSRYNHEYGGIEAIHGHSGRMVAIICEYAIRKLKSEGVVMPTVGNYGNWGFGMLPTYPREEMEEMEHKGVFMYHLNQFRELGDKYFDCRFISDSYGDDECNTTYCMDYSGEIDVFTQLKRKNKQLELLEREVEMLTAKLDQIENDRKKERSPKAHDSVGLFHQDLTCAKEKPESEREQKKRRRRRRRGKKESI